MKNLLGSSVVRTLRIVLCVAGVSTLSGCIVHVGHNDDYRHPSEQFNAQLSMSAQGVKQLMVESGYGLVIVKGVAGLEQIEVDARISADAADGEDYIFTIDRLGHEAVLVGKARGHFNNRGIKVDLTVSVPARLALKIDDGAGSIDVMGMHSSVKINDGSGSINVSHIGGDVDIEDGSGGINLTDIQGNIVIDDSSGGMIISQVKGTVDIEDGSGGIDVSDVDNTVTITDGSGGIRVNRVAKLNIVEAGSGSVDIDDVEEHDH